MNSVLFFFSFLGIEIFEFCYSEAQAGKSYCDAKIAHMRQKIKTYVATGHNVCTAAEMKEALDSGHGMCIIMSLILRFFPLGF